MRRDEQRVGDAGPPWLCRSATEAVGVHGEPELRVAHVEQQQRLLAVALAADAQREGGRFQVRGLRAGPNQPRVTAAEPISRWCSR